MFWKYLIVLGVIAVIFYLLLFWRLRRYIPLVRRIFHVTRVIYRMTRGTGSGMEQPSAAAKRGEGERLVRCAACGTWIPEGRALQLKSTAYCSTSCLENAATQPERPARRSARG